MATDSSEMKKNTEEDEVIAEIIANAAAAYASDNENDDQEGDDDYEGDYEGDVDHEGEEEDEREYYDNSAAVKRALEILMETKILKDEVIIEGDMFFRMNDSLFQDLYDRLASSNQISNLRLCITSGFFYNPELFKYLLRLLSLDNMPISLELHNPNLMLPEERFLALCKGIAEAATLYALSFDSFLIPDNLHSALLKSIAQCKKLKYLQCSRNICGEKSNDLRLLIETIRTLELETLSFACSEIFSTTDDDFKILCDTFMNSPTLKKLFICESIGTSTSKLKIQYLCKAIEGLLSIRHLRLDIFKNYEGDPTIYSQIFKSLIRSPVEGLDLSHNKLRNVNVHLLTAVRALITFSNIQTLSIMHGFYRLPDNIISQFLEAFRANKLLTTFIMDHPHYNSRNHIDRSIQIYDQINKIVQANVERRQDQERFSLCLGLHHRAGAESALSILSKSEISDLYLLNLIFQFKGCTKKQILAKDDKARLSEKRKHDEIDDGDDSDEQSENPSKRGCLTKRVSTSGAGSGAGNTNPAATATTLALSLNDNSDLERGPSTLPTGAGPGHNPNFNANRIHLSVSLEAGAGAGAGVPILPTFQAAVSQVAPMDTTNDGETARVNISL